MNMHILFVLFCILCAVFSRQPYIWCLMCAHAINCWPPDFLVHLTNQYHSNTPHIVAKTLSIAVLRQEHATFDWLADEYFIVIPLIGCSMAPYNWFHLGTCSISYWLYHPSAESFIFSYRFSDLFVAMLPTNVMACVQEIALTFAFHVCLFVLLLYLAFSLSST